MALTKVAVDYIREHRGESSDASIRAALAGQGFSAETLDEAFAQTGLRPAPAQASTPPAPSAAPAAPKRRLWIWVLGSVIGAVVLAFAGLLALGSWVVSKERKEQLPAAVADYHPEPLAPPANLPMFLPEDLLDEDAAQDYMAIIATKGGLMDGDPATDTRPPTAEQIALMDSALKKRRSTFGSLLVRPGTDAFLAATTVKINVLLSLSQHLRDRFKAASERGDWAQAEVEARRRVLLGWHSAQDWDLAMQMLGMSTMIGGLLEESMAAEKLGKRDAENMLAAQRTPLDMLAYAAGKEEVNAIPVDASELEKLPRLMERIADPAKRRAYASWTLLCVATSWSVEEKRAGRAAPARTAFFLEAASLGDPVLARLAKAFAGVLKDAEGALAGVPAEKRAAVLDEINKRMAPKGPSNF
ncbi:MAG: hypothetical protein Q8T11_16730 [Elusimicrobiota bacterium]|nr:hypothetical protein [Elusimicrobiota bacterium]